MLKPSGEEEKDDFTEHKDEEEVPRAVPNIEYPMGSQGRPTCQQLDHDMIINAEVTLKLDVFQINKVNRRIVGAEGKANGFYNDNPDLNSTFYDAEFSNRKV